MPACRIIQWNPFIMAFRTSPLACLLLIAFAGAASAQSTSGNIAGDASPGDVVVVAGENNTYKREIKVGEDGKYKARRLPIGTYNVTFVHPDGSMQTLQSVGVRPDGTSRVSSPALDAGSGAPAASP